MNAVAWIVLGGVLALVACVGWLSVRLDQSARSIAGIARAVKEHADANE